MPVTYEDVESAAERLRGVANKTPVLRSRTFNDLVGAEVFFKAENYQRVGAFKFRGAYNAFSQLTEEQKRNGVLTFSSGNHGAACALSGRLLGVPVVVVMNHDAPQMKKDAVAGYGAEVVLYDRDEQVREELGEKIAAERGLTIVPPYDHPHIVAGQGTAGKELFEEVPDLDVLVVGCGGGGLISGCSIAAKRLSPSTKIYGVEPEKGNDGQLSFRKGELVRLPKPPDTIADGARTTSLGKITFALIKQNVEDMLTVSDDELLVWTKFFFERMKTVVEPTGALAAAAIATGKIDLRGKRVGALVTGGNADVASLFC
ncbi:MAG TPA: threo-3-hydroxy-L-aspartate ammonia-lyase [Fimbriimonadaceae bacterium]|nr:threo-3-hydroxy-L-aspartate ammonia-lyase [Fimbriimonadaceae bacterium]